MSATQLSSRRLSGALIGYGFISGNGHVPAYLERKRTTDDVEIVAVADICAARRELARKALPQARIYPDYASLLQAEAGRLDFVDISTPPCDHAKVAHAAFDHGLHVLCEKPLTTTLEDAAALLEHARRARRVLFPCHNYKHAPVAKKVREIIDSGRIGKVRALTLNTFRNTHAKGVTEWHTHWRREHRYSGGGIAMDHGSHSFYLTFDWMGAYPTAVTAKMSNLEPGRWDTEDNFSAALTFPNGVAYAQLTWTAGVRKVMYTVQGDQGAITIDDDDLQLAVMRRTDGPDVAQGAVTWEVEKYSISSHWMDASHVSWFNSMFDQFLVAIRDGDFVGKDAREAYLCIQIITQAYRSAADSCREKPLSAEAWHVPSVPMEREQGLRLGR
ncbi:MAG: Gfo/Idh/MocA family protein [Hyalangium sp.]|uniref:Gfo/Idh/MocA family protein n=1 Tax=Hyalangium sp. TaxID=2028555 RepID=UPI00389ABA12